MPKLWWYFSISIYRCEQVSFRSVHWNAISECVIMCIAETCRDCVWCIMSVSWRCWYLLCSNYRKCFFQFCFSEPISPGIRCGLFFCYPLNLFSMKRRWRQCLIARWSKFSGILDELVTNRLSMLYSTLEMQISEVLIKYNMQWV